jgi:hypothetical protein
VQLQKEKENKMITHIIISEKARLTIPRMAGKIKDQIFTTTTKIDRIGSNYNGYGYSDWEYQYHMDHKELLKIKRLLKAKDKKPKAPAKTPEQKLEAWCKRLDKLTGCGIETAKMIAAQKLDYKQEQINRLNERQFQSQSRKREQLINQIERSNPLRPIKDLSHAEAILAAHHRHTETNYEAALDYARDLAEEGEIDRSEVKEWARENYSKGE